MEKSNTAPPARAISPARKSQKRIRTLRGTTVLGKAMGKQIKKALAGNSY